ncbi:MAG: hypothetical protein EAX86_09510 [Candidatus Heimdallarchaeota archaeon]|nr:hypothetical protein [Candidatus Heimdallarchaeota archaeon]
MSAENEYLLKIPIIGENTLLNAKFGRLTAEGKFNENSFPSYGVEIVTKKIRVEEDNVKLILVIVAGSCPNYYRGASGCVILFDKGTVKTFTQVTRWLAEFRKSIPEVTIPIAIVGVKTEDQEELITPEEGQQLAEKLQIAYYETTLTDKAHVEYILTEISKKALATKEWFVIQDEKP